MALVYAMERKPWQVHRGTPGHPAETGRNVDRAAAAALLVQAASKLTAGSAATWKKGRRGFSPQKRRYRTA